jgi:hypothetical protein
MFGTINHVRAVLRASGAVVAVPNWRHGAQVWRNRDNKAIHVSPGHSDDWSRDWQEAKEALQKAGYATKEIKRDNFRVLEVSLS